MNTTQIISTIIAFIITSAIVYFFKQRQLYLSLTNLYSNSTISDKGSICQFIIYNQGNSVEENIRIELNPNIQVSLLSTDSSILQFENNVISIELLHKKSKVSCMLLVENDQPLSLNEIQSFYSKETKGKSFNNSSLIPSNAGNVAIFFGFMAFIIICGINLPKTIEFFHDKYLHNKYSYLYNLGWSNLNNYSGSDLEKKSYTTQEFPIKFIKREIDINNPKLVTYTFEVINKTANDLTVNVQNSNISTEKWKEDKNSYGLLSTIEVKPVSTKELKIKTKLFKDEVLEFYFNWQNNYIFNILYTVKSE